MAVILYKSQDCCRTVRELPYNFLKIVLRGCAVNQCSNFFILQKIQIMTHTFSPNLIVIPFQGRVSLHQIPCSSYLQNDMEDIL